MEEPVNVKFKLASISNEHFSASPEKMEADTITEASLQFQYKIGTIIKLSENMITVVISVRYSVEGSLVFEAGADFNYSIIPLDTVLDVDKENHKITMKVDILPTLIGAAFSSLRGIVYVRTLSTPLEKYPVPMIDINTLLAKNGISLGMGGLGEK